jgi:hypothetical protein
MINTQIGAHLGLSVWVTWAASSLPVSLARSTPAGVGAALRIIRKISGSWTFPDDAQKEGIRLSNGTVFD